jgi:uncharacterized protein DUF4159
MRLSFILAAGWLASFTAVYAFQMPFRVLRSQEGYDNMVLPPDYQDRNEFVIGRLMYPSLGGGGFRGGGNWVYGGTMWSNDYPIGDRAFARILRRLTRIDTRSVEQPINLNDGDDVYNWPWIYAAHVETMDLTDSMVKKLHEYLDRGGFFYADDFWGDAGWAAFRQTLDRILPGSQTEDIPDSDPIYHLLFDLNDRFMVANHNMLMATGLPYHNIPGGTVAHWRGIRDAKGRIVVVMNFNSDVGDSWEWADRPEYPEKYSNLGMRISTNYVTYAMTH